MGSYIQYDGMSKRCPTVREEGEVYLNIAQWQTVLQNFKWLIPPITKTFAQSPSRTVQRNSGGIGSASIEETKDG